MEQYENNMVFTDYLDENYAGKWLNHHSTYETIVWVDDFTPPSQADFDAAIDAANTAYINKQYQRDRVYPEIGEQLDMLWHAIDTGTLDNTSEFYTTLKAVKDANPKPQ